MTGDPKLDLFRDGPQCVKTATRWFSQGCAPA